MLLPGELLPLHIFEERYKEMVEHSLASGEPFGIVFRDEEDGAHDIGCTADVAEVLERFDDGRLNIIVSGGTPFRIVARNGDEDHPAGTIEPIDLAAEPDDEDPEARERAGEAFAELAREAAEDPDDIPEAGEDNAYELAARITLPPETKQKLLETRSEAERIRLLARALEAVLRAVRRSQAIAETAQTNGHGQI